MLTDANWAGCRTASKSKSGGAILLGRGCVETWSKTRRTIAQSFAESEWLASVRGAAEAIGFIALAKGVRIEFTACLHIDASAALGILKRKGVGRERHVNVGLL